MKRTSYEISKQLAEAGFKAENDFYWAKWNEGDPELVHAKDGTPPLIEKVPAYDLETILQALPNVVNDNEELNIKKHEIGYYYFDYDCVICGTGVEKQESESLTDTAARLWLKLKKQGLI